MHRFLKSVNTFTFLAPWQSTLSQSSQFDFKYSINPFNINMTQLEVSPKSHMRPLKCAYDPLLPPPLGSSVQLTAQISSILQQDHPNSILLTPSEPSVAVPWPSSLLHCRQNIYWREAESAARALIPQLHTLSRQNGAKIPKELQQADGKTTESDVEKMKAIRKKETEFVDTVVGCGVYMHPNANKERMQLIVQALLVLWTHDDTVEENPEDLVWLLLTNHRPVCR